MRYVDASALVKGYVDDRLNAAAGLEGVKLAPSVLTGRRPRG
jgi:hypothetical protein